MTLTNTNDCGDGINMSNAKVELFDVAIKKCKSCALFIRTPTSETTVVATRCEFANSRNGARVFGSLTSATFKNCVFHDNEEDEIHGSSSTIHLHGEATAIHSNKGQGISAWSSGKVILHLPSHYNTSYNNGEGDRETISGGTITNVED